MSVCRTEDDNQLVVVHQVSGVTRRSSPSPSPTPRQEYDAPMLEEEEDEMREAAADPEQGQGSGSMALVPLITARTPAATRSSRPLAERLRDRPGVNPETLTLVASGNRRSRTAPKSGMFAIADAPAASVSGASASGCVG